MSEEAGVNLPAVARYKARQLLAVPLLSADGSVLGMFGVLDRLDDTGISREDIRRARALAAQVSVVLEVAHNLHQSELNRRRSDVLIQLARDIDGMLRLPDFARKFVDRAVELTEARAGALALFQDGRFQTVALYPLPAAASNQRRHPSSIAANVNRSVPGLAIIRQPEIPHKHNLPHSQDHESQDPHSDVYSVEVRARPDDQALHQRFARAVASWLAGTPIPSFPALPPIFLARNWPRIWGGTTAWWFACPVPTENSLACSAFRDAPAHWRPKIAI